MTFLSCGVFRLIGRELPTVEGINKWDSDSSISIGSGSCSSFRGVRVGAPLYVCISMVTIVLYVQHRKVGINKWDSDVRWLQKTHKRIMWHHWSAVVACYLWMYVSFTWPVSCVPDGGVGVPFIYSFHGCGFVSQHKEDEEEGTEEEEEE